jgi:hypothetical protein
VPGEEVGNCIGYAVCDPERAQWPSSAGPVSCHTVDERAQGARLPRSVHGIH